MKNYSIYHPACIWRGYDPCVPGHGREVIPYIKPDQVLYIKSDECGGCEFMILPKYVVSPDKRFSKSLFEKIYSSESADLGKMMFMNKENKSYIMNGEMANGLTMIQIREARDIVKRLVSGKKIHSESDANLIGLKLGIQ